MNIEDLSRIDRTIEIKAPPEKVWRALTTKSEISSWFQVEVDGEIAVGNEVWMTSVHPGHEGQRFSVKFVEMTPPRRFVWQWHPGAVDPTFDYSQEPRTTVTFTLEPLDGGTRLSLAETGFDAITLTRRTKAFEDNSGGWTTVVGWIQQYVEKAG